MFEKLKEVKSFRYIYNFFYAIYIIAVIACFILIPIFIFRVIEGKNVKEVFMEILDFGKVLGGIYLFILISVLVIMLIKHLIDTSVQNEKNKLSIVAQIILFISVFYDGIICIWFVVNGLHSLYSESGAMFIAFICSAAYVLYYSFKEKKQKIESGKLNK